MTIKQLKEAIADLPDDMEVLQYTDNRDIGRHINGVQFKMVKKDNYWYLIASRPSKETRDYKKALFFL